MKRVKHIFSYILVLSMCFTLFFFPVEVSAEGTTYNVISECTKVFNNISTGMSQFVNVRNNSSDVRFVIGYDSRQYIICGLLSDQPFEYSTTYTSNNSSCSNNYNSVSSGLSGYFPSSSGKSLYIVTWQQGSKPYSYSTIVDNYTTIPGNYYYNSSYANQPFYNSAYGDNAIGPEPPGPTWGKPANVMYNTRIAGSGSASENNIDRIVWSPNIDSNANELPPGAKVQIRAVPGSYTADSSQNVLQQTWNDFRLDNSKQYTVFDGNADLGRFEIKWGEVVDHFGFFPYSWVPDIQLVDDYYLKMGWIYQIRLIINEYESDWINIYTATSSGAEPSEVITHSDDLTQELVQNILIVNSLNETNNVNWQINDTTINNSEYVEPGTNQKPWWAYLLEAIVSLLNPNDETNIVINNTNNENQDLNNKLNEYNQIEEQQITNLNNSLEDITVESSMLSDSKFVSSAQWVAQQYNRMTSGTVIGSLIGFSLLFGLALIFIGKIR